MEIKFVPAEVTVRFADPLMLEMAAVIVAVPFFRPLAIPVESTEAMAVLDEVH